MAGEFLFPRQMLPYKSKTKSWRKACVNAGANKNLSTYSPIRNSMIHKAINIQLLNGKLHMKDLELIVNPNRQEASFIPDKIQHYPIMNAKIDVLIGEALARAFDYRVVVTNPTAISEIERNKKDALLAALQQEIMDQSESEEDFQKNITKISDYFTYEWQDLREQRANFLLNHYVKQYNMRKMFDRDGFLDACSVAEEIYQCDIVCGEPTIEKLDPQNVHVYQSGYSNKIEDADMIVVEEYWSPGKVYDTFHDVLTKSDCDYIEKIAAGNYYESAENEDVRIGLVPNTLLDDMNVKPEIGDLFPANELDSVLPFEMTGNIRVSKVYWKSRRKIKKVKYYNPFTGEPEFELMPETYIPNKDRGEEVEDLWINQAWEGVRIGDKVYVNMRPRPIQYNSISNPSKCHFGIIGTIYNINSEKPFSLVDKMKPYNYLYDVIHDRLNKLIARNYGKCIEFDFAKIPNDWDPDKWLYFLRTNGIAVKDSFKEGNKGATGKLAGMMNTASSGVIDLELGQSIQSQIQLLEYIKNEMAEAAGISKQREGQIANRETVGGVERATLQSSHITEWLFAVHDDTKKRALECFLETAKIALRGKNKKFQYILPDASMKIMEIDGDEFAECDYGLVVDNSEGLQKLNSQIETLGQAGLQNGSISFSTLLKIYGTSSLAEKQRFIERDEQQLREMRQQQQQQQLQQQQQIAQMEQETAVQKMQQEDALNQRDNDTKIIVAQIQAESRNQSQDIEPDDSMSEGDRARLDEQIREFDQKIDLENRRLEFDKQKAATDAEIKRKQASRRPASN